MKRKKKNTHARLGSRKDRKETLLAAMTLTDKEWWTARELYDLNLFDEPITRNYINVLLRELYQTGQLSRKSESSLHAGTSRWSYSIP